jgi:hypothetical protein
MMNNGLAKLFRIEDVFPAAIGCMSYAFHRTSLVGFPIQYGQSRIASLNPIVGAVSRTHLELDDLARRIAPGGLHVRNVRTADKYCWFGSMEWFYAAVHVCLLLPWHQDFYSQESLMDRSVALYSQKRLSLAHVNELCDHVKTVIAGHNSEVASRDRTIHIHDGCWRWV